MKSAAHAIFAGALLTLAIVTAACGGGHGDSSLPGQSQNGGLTNGSVLFTIPNATTSGSSAARKAQFVSASVASVGVTVNGGTPTFVGVAASSGLCTATTNGRTCAIPLSAPAGSITFGFTLYDGANGAGNVLGTGTATQTVVIGSPFTVSVTVSGTVASVAVTVPVIDVGPTSVPVTVTAKDADGNTIIGAAPYAAPISLTNSDTTGTTILSTTTVSSPSTAVTLSYTGGALSKPASIAPSAPGVPAAASSPAAVLPLNYFPTGFSRTFGSVSSYVISYIPIGASSPRPTYTPTPSPGSYVESITSGAAFNGVTGAQAILAVSSTGFQEFGSGVGSTTYQSIANGAVKLLGVSNPTCPTQTTTYTNGLPYATVPFVTGSLPATSPAYTSTYSYSAACGYGLTYTYTITADSSGNVDQLLTYSDGSTEDTKSNADGTGTDAYVAGNMACNGSWLAGQPCAMTSAVAMANAPTNGSVTINVTQTTSSGTQTGSITIPVGTLYPTGVPKATYSVASTIGAPITSAPPPCAVTAPFTGPVVPVTTVTSTWQPAAAVLSTTTEVDYLAPSIGKVCITQAQVSSIPVYMYQTGTSYYAVFAYVPLPLGLPSYIDSSADSETDSVTSTGPPWQAGTVITTGRARATLGAGVTPWRLRSLQFHGAMTGGVRL